MKKQGGRIMKKGRFDEMRNGSEDKSKKQKEVIQIMRKDREIRSWSSMIAVVVAVMGMSLFLVQVVGAVNYTITVIPVTPSNGGTITPGTSTVVGGTDKAFTITPKAGYAIEKLIVDYVPQVPPRKTYKFPKVSANHTITATFTPDSDNDGIPDNLEQAGISLTLPLPDGVKYYPPCPQNVSPTDRPKCVDKATKDVFVVLVPAQPAQGGRFSTLQDPLQFATKTVGGLPLTVHWIVLQGVQDTSDRFLNYTSANPSAQKYVRITESLNEDDPTVLGSSTCGTPDQDLGTVYTKRIANHVTSVNAGASENDINKYIKHTIAHELGHMVGPLAPVYNANYGGYHYASDANDQIMDMAVFVTGTGSNAVFYIGTSYTSADQAGVKLK
jgi:hypothetical protein